MNKYIKTALLGLLTLNSFSAFPMEPARGLVALNAIQKMKPARGLACLNTIPNCSICLNDMTENAFTTPCKHTYHRSCLQNWKAAKDAHSNSLKCPYCTQTFNTDALMGLTTQQKIKNQAIRGAIWTGQKTLHVGVTAAMVGGTLFQLISGLVFTHIALHPEHPLLFRLGAVPIACCCFALTAGGTLLSLNLFVRIFTGNNDE